MPNTVPRLCAHRGLSAACPENTLPAFGAAVALGVPEIELDVWGSRDGQLVVCHDDTVDRTTDGVGRIGDMDWTDLRALDAGGWLAPAWAGVRLCTLNAVFAAFGGRVVMNLHLKEAGAGGWIIARVQELARECGITDSIYLAGEADVLEPALRLAPELERCCLDGQYDGTIVDHALEFRCARVQFFTPYYTPELIQRARAAGLICNFFWEDTVEGATRAFGEGVDVLLTNAAHQVAAALPG